MSPRLRILLLVVAVCVLAGLLWYGPLTSSESRTFASDWRQLDQRLDASGRLRGGEGLVAGLRVVEAEGLPKELMGREVEFAFQLPDRLRLVAEVDGKAYRLGRDGEVVWMETPHSGFAVRGSSEVPRFAGFPDSVEEVRLPEWRSPLSSWQFALLPALVRVERSDAATGEDDAEGSARFRGRLRPWVARRIGAPEELVFEWQRDIGGRLVEIGADTGNARLRFALDSLAWTGRGAEDAFEWGISEVPEEKVERVALSHLVRFARVALKNLDARIPTLPPADGSRELLATHGKGRLEKHDGTLVLFLEGTPEEMGVQHGALLAEQVRHLVDRIVYGVGIGSSVGKGRWFFGEIEEAQSRLEPFTDERHLREMDALAATVGLHPQEVRLANFFPELFHCSGFALHGSATVDGRLYHGRVLDYLRGLGLEENAVVMVVQPDEGNAWVNVGYAGFIGTVTAMNERQVAIGEMGGRGEGDWDGKPMAQLMREVMERADTIDEAVEIMRRGPRTCEYYYVISDAKSGRAAGIKGTPEIFETVWSGEAHPELPRAVPDAVILSSGGRYEALVDRVESGFGSFDAASARALMERPVCMESNIQSVLFAPDTLDFWVANADSENVASHTRYTRYNLRELLDRATPVPDPDLTKAKWGEVGRSGAKWGDDPNQLQYSTAPRSPWTRSP